MSAQLSNLRLGFAGTPEFAVPALEALANSSHKICAVFTQPDRPAGRGRTKRAGAVKRRAIELGLPVHQPESFKLPAAQGILDALALDALIVVAYGLILPPAALGAPKLGCFNIHASLLPRWRGAAPIQRALMAGDSTTGVSIMRMESGLDTGPILAQRTIDIGELDTGKSLHDRLARLGAELLCESMGALMRGSIVEVPQSVHGVTYAEKIRKSEACIDWRQTAVQIWRLVRAFNPRPVAETRLNGEQLRIWDAQLLDIAPGAEPGSVLRATEQGIDVACGQGALRVLRLQQAGRKPLEAREFVRANALAGARLALP